MAETLKITQAMNEIKLAEKKIENSMDFIARNLIREEDRRDPFEKDGTTQATMVQRELQSIRDLETRIIRLKLAINEANLENTLTVENQSRTIAEWLIYRRDVLPKQKLRLQTITQMIGKTEAPSLAARRSAAMQGVDLLTAQWIINLSEKDLLEQIQQLDAIDERLDAMLSLANANIDIII